MYLNFLWGPKKNSVGGGEGGGKSGGRKERVDQGWILLRDLRDYIIDNLEKCRQYSPGNTV